jgi:hypothetical protein
MLARTIKMAFWVTWDHMGKLMLANLLWAVSVSLPGAVAVGAWRIGEPGTLLAIGVPAALLSLGIALPLATVGLAYMAKQLIDTRDGAFVDFFTGMRQYGVRAIRTTLVLLVAAVSLATSVWFYASKLGDALPWLGYAISGVALWGLVLVAFVALLAMPAVVQKREGIVATLKVAALLVLDNPMLMLGLAGQIAALTVLSLMIVPLFFFVYGAFVVVLASSAYEMLSRKYAAIEARHDAEAAGLDAAPEATDPVLIFDDEKDDYLNRGVRDALFPWKG